MFRNTSIDAYGLASVYNVKLTPLPPLEDAAYTNSALGFSIQPPKGWPRDDSGKAGTLVFFASPRLDTDGGQSFVANINIIIDPMRGKDFDGYVQLTKQLLLQQAQGARISGDRSVSLGSDNSYLLEWTWPVPQGGPTVKILTLLTPSQGNQGAAFVVTFTALESAWNKYQDMAHAALLSVRTAMPTQVPPLLEFMGKVPSLTRIAYATPEGETVTVPAIGGWVSVVAAQGVTNDQALRVANSAGATVVEANVKLGLFTLSTGDGKEGTLIARLRQESWVVEASPAFLVGRTQKGDKPVRVVDYPFDPADKAVGNPCDDSHGNLTALQITRAGQKAEIVDVRNRKAVMDPQNGAAFAWYFDTGNKILEAMNTGSVVNASLGAGNSFPIKVKDRIGDTQFDYKLVGAEYKHAQAAFLAMVFRVAEEGPDVPIVVSAGNGDALNHGQDLTKYMEALRKQFPNAARRVRLAEAWWTNPKTGAWERAPWSDYSSVGSIAAPGVEVSIETTGVRGLPVGSVKCSGTSFAAPVVTAMMDSMQKAAPDKSAGELWVRFEKVTQKKLGEDWGKTGLPNRLAREAAGRGIASVQLEPPVTTVQAGKNQQFRPIARDASGAIIPDLPASAFTWSSSGTAIATVNINGSALGKASGKAEITVSIEGITGKAALTVAAAKPDLTVTTVSFNPSSGRVGDTFSVTYTIKNEGDTESGPFSNRVSLATARFGTNYSLGNFSMESLSAGASMTVTVTTSAIPSSTAEGSYWVTVFTDGFQSINEANENNNIGSSDPSKFAVVKGENIYQITMNLKIDVDGLAERSYERIVTKETTVVTLNFGEFRLSPGSTFTRIETTRDGNTYQYNGSLSYYRHPEGPRYDPSWVLQSEPGGQFSNSGALGGYAGRQVSYVAGPPAAVALRAADSKLSLFFEGWRPKWSYLFGPHMVLNYTLEDFFAKDRQLNPVGETIVINGSFIRGFDQVGTQKYTYSGTLTLKLVRSE